MREIENLKKAILEEYPRLDKDSEFNFGCHKGVPCFNDCCGDVNIFLTPYDIIRLKDNLGITSGEFLEKYTISPFDENLKYPIVLLKMNDDAKKTCPFVSENGCRVYPDRPWACRMYPLGLASPGQGNQQLDSEFYFLLKESICKGFESQKHWTVSDWLADQGIDDYNRMGEYFKDITLHRFFLEGGNLPPEKIEMFYTVCYDIDKFKRFIFGSSFFDKFDVDEATIDRIKNDEIELLKFGYRWLKFALFGEKTITVKTQVLDARKKDLEHKKRKQ